MPTLDLLYRVLAVPRASTEAARTLLALQRAERLQTQRRRWKEKRRALGRKRAK